MTSNVLEALSIRIPLLAARTDFQREPPPLGALLRLHLPGRSAEGRGEAELKSPKAASLDPASSLRFWPLQSGSWTEPTCSRLRVHEPLGETGRTGPREMAVLCQ